jgi:hypothetical protein
MKKRSKLISSLSAMFIIVAISRLIVQIDPLFILGMSVFSLMIVSSQFFDLFIEAEINLVRFYKTQKFVQLSSKVMQEIVLITAFPLAFAVPFYLFLLRVVPDRIQSLSDFTAILALGITLFIISESNE